MDRTPGDDVVAAVRAFVEDRAGVTAVEYALIAGLIALAIISAVTLVGSNLTSFFMNLHTNISTIA
jgi:pilus assembly protein Flp/PilA